MITTRIPERSTEIPCWLTAWVLLAVLVSTNYPAAAQNLTNLDEISFVADIDTTVPGNGGGDLHGDDAAVTRFNVITGTATSSNDLGALDRAGIDAFHRSGDGCGDSIYSLDTITVIAGTVMRPADVFTALGNLVLDADGAGIPPGVDVDAISRDPDNCNLLLSIDVTAILSGTAFRPDDLIRWTSGAGFSLYSATGFNSNIDALHLLAPNRMLVSIDAGTTLPDVEVLNDDILEIGTGGSTFQLIAFEPALLNNSWQGADLNALWVMPAPLVGAIQWTEGSVNVLENAGSIALFIERVGGSVGSVTIAWETTPITATPGADYVPVSNALIMADGQTSAQVSVTLLDDNLIEGTESFSVVLSISAGGAQIGSPAIQQINLLDNEDYIFADGFE